MNRKIFNIFLCTLLIVSIIPIIKTHAKLYDISTQPTITWGSSPLYFSLYSKTWSYTNNTMHIQTRQNIPNSNFGMFSLHKSSLYQFNNIEYNNITTIREESSHQVLVIKLSSAYDLNILNFTAEFNLSIINKQKTEYSHKYGIYILDASGNIHDYISLNWITGPGLRNLRYFKLGSFLYDKRGLYDHVGWVSTGEFIIPNYALAAGEWYLVFYAGFYDVPNINTHLQTKISINIINIPIDLKVTKNEEGIFYGLWYGEFNPTFALTKGWAFSAMLNGATQFSVKNTFLFSFDRHPISNGFWNVNWTTPTGIKNCTIEIKDGIFTSSSSKEDIQWCVFGNGGSGNYIFTTHYIDRWSKEWWAFPIYLSAVDTPLN